MFSIKSILERIANAIESQVLIEKEILVEQKKMFALNEEARVHVLVRDEGIAQREQTRLNKWEQYIDMQIEDLKYRRQWLDGLDDINKRNKQEN